MCDIHDKIMYYSLLNSNYGRLTITDKDIQKSTNIPKDDIITFLNQNNSLFNIGKLKKDICPECNSQLIDTDTGICGSCGTKLNSDLISSCRIDINKTGFEVESLNLLIKSLEKNDWELKTKEHNLSYLIKDDFILAIYFSLDKITLKDYYYLKGWLPSTKNVCYILFSKASDQELINFTTKFPNINLENSANLFLDDERNLLLSKINYSLENILEENEFEEKAEGRFNEEPDIQNIRLELDNLLKNLDDLALHNNDLSNPGNGYKYQSSIIKLLNLTILPIKVLAKQNIQDILIRVPQNFGEVGKQVRWLPLEIKSFRPKSKSKPYFNLKDYGSQYRKYIEGYLDTKVQSIAKIECFVITAYDFLLDEENDEFIKQLEKDFQYKIRISLIPQRSLIYLVTKNLDQKNPIIDYDHIIDLFRENRYIDKKEIDDFYNSIDHDFKESGEEVTFKKVQERVNKMGK